MKILIYFVIVIEGLLILIYAYSGIKKNNVASKKNLWYFIPVFVIVFTNYYIGYYYKGEKTNIFVISSCVNASLKAFIFDLKQDYVRELINDNLVFHISFNLGVFMASFTLISSIVLLLKNKMINFVKVIIYKNKPCDIILYNKKRRDEIISYIKNYKPVMLWIEKELSKNDFIDFINLNVPIINLKFNKNNIKKVLNKKLSYNFICFEEEDNYSNLFEKILNISIEFKNINFYIETNNENRDLIVSNYIKINKLDSVVYLFSRHELIARQFIINYPMSLKIPRDFLNEDLTVKEDVHLNFFIVGYGKIGEEIYKLNIINNQFASLTEFGLNPKFVNYHIFDKNQDREESIYTNRISKKFKYLNEYEYFPFPYKVNNTIFYKNDCNNNVLINKTIEELRNDKTFSYIVISTGSDFDNIKIANELLDFIKSNCLYDKEFTIFIRLKNSSQYNYSNVFDKKIIQFGDLESINNHKVIINDELAILARKNNDLYNKNNPNNQIDWHSLSYIKKYSNIYSSINIRSKLNLLNLDYTNKENESISIEEYYKIYGTNIFNYENYEIYFDYKIRNVLGFIEHLRWNAFYLLEGYIPLKKANIKYVNNKFITKNEDDRQHCCLTTYNGLDEYAKYLIDLSDNEVKISDVEVYRYDYQIMDNLYEHLKSVGIYITKK